MTPEKREEALKIIDKIYHDQEALIAALYCEALQGNPQGWTEDATDW